MIIEEDGIYDPRSSNDQIVLGLKGAFSVMESRASGRLEKDPNERTRASVGLVFSKFRELGSVRQVTLWLRRENVCLPRLTTGGPRRPVEWMLPTYTSPLMS